MVPKAAQLLGLATPQVLDLAFAVISLALFTLYHVWYYSWHLWGLPLPTRGVHRLDMTGQTARVLFTQASFLPPVKLTEWKHACTYRRVAGCVQLAHKGRQRLILM